MLCPDGEIGRPARHVPYADVMKLVNMHDSKSCAARLVGSSPTIGTRRMAGGRAGLKIQ